MQMKSFVDIRPEVLAENLGKKPIITSPPRTHQAEKTAGNFPVMGNMWESAARKAEKCSVDNLVDVGGGKIASVITSLEMFEPPSIRPEQADPSWVFQRVERPELAWYRKNFRHIGEDYLWYGHLQMTDDALRAILHHPLFEVYILENNDEPVALLDLDFREEKVCEIAYFGVVSHHLGKGMGRYLMNRALEIAWSHPIRQFRVRTCTLDHPNALPFYMRSGFRPFRRQVEFLDDARAIGLLSRNAAPQIPLL